MEIIRSNPAKSGEIYVTSDKVFIYLCLFCEQQFLTNQEFVEHISASHIENDETEVDLKDYEGTDFCESNECDQLCENKEQQVVPPCQTDISLKDGDGFCKKDIVSLVSGRVLHKCSYCKKEFQNKYNLESHRSIHEGTTEYKCPNILCSKAFRTKSGLSKHMIIHRRERPHKCEFCSHRSNYKSNLGEHVRRYHTLEKPFKCQYCEKTFVSGTERRMHERVHTGEKPYICELCGKKFKSSSTLSYHQYKHNGVKKFQCTQCDKAFYSPNILWDHSLTHSSGKQLSCDVCGQSCKHIKSLRQHKRLHEEKKYVCKICQKAFAQNSGLYFHMKSH